jgi:hypothetical protein
MLPHDLWRSMPLAQFEPLARVENVRLISLQRGSGTEQLAALGGRFPVIDVARDFDDSEGVFLDTAAVMMNLDLVVTCCTSIAHLAGALGVPTWIALQAVPAWRWLLDREDTPWYPTVRLFRQTQFGAWEEPFRRMAHELDRLVRGDRLIALEIAPGELLDRQVILEIKARKIDDEQRRANVIGELAGLERARLRVPGGFADLEPLVVELRTVNEAIWEAEDVVRHCEAESDFGPRFIAAARSVYKNNDARAALKRRINEVLGCGLQEEKHYAGS